MNIGTKDNRLTAHWRCEFQAMLFGLYYAVIFQVSIEERVASSKAG